MVNNFHYKETKFWDLNMHVLQIGWDGCNLIKQLDEDPRVNRVTIRGKIYNPVKMKIIMHALKNTQVQVLDLGNNSINSYVAKCIADGLRYTNITTLSLYGSQMGDMGAKYLADILKNTCITYLSIPFNNIGDVGMKHLASGLKNSNVISLDVSDNGIKSDGIKYLADALQDTNLTSLNLNSNWSDWNQIADEGVKYLSEHLKHANITYLELDCNNISNHGVKYLAEHLKDTCITSLSFKSNNIDNTGIQYLVQTLQDTQIIQIDLGCINIEYNTKTVMTEAISQNERRASKIIDIFEKLVAQNTQTYDLEFIIPNEIKDLDMAEYLYIIKIINDEPKVKGHIFDLIRQNNCNNYPNIIKKINEFIAIMPNKFNTFIENKLPSLLALFNNYDYVNLLKQFENEKLHEVVQNLLLHRVLYYVDENAEFLHPYIYKMLHKYSMPLYNEQLEPNKKEKIISFYQSHQEIDGAQEIIDLLGPESLQ